MNYFEDYQIGDRTVTKGRTITEADIVMFAAFSGDWHQLHTDAEFAKRGPFGERIAHGFMVLTVASGLMGFDHMAIQAFYGLDRVRFIGPTKIGDTLHLEMQVTDKREKTDQAGVVTWATKVMNQHDQAVAVMESKALIAKK